ncbi:MAG: cytochrome c biogenesis protein CcsA, partial [Bacteroidia bacterium]|nr:cytochrome c biogenesis protein CcsA [Bacteroidia bacterium]
PFEGNYMQMVTQEITKLEKDSIQPFNLRSLYTIGNMRFVMPEPIFKGIYSMVEKEQKSNFNEDGLVLKVTSNGETKFVNVLGGPGTNNAFKQIKVGGLDFAFRYGPRVLELPFSIKLNDFIAERYPGTEKSYSSFESKVTVNDPKEGEFDFRIYMNNILNHRGYRFFQSSFDQDEKGTILSVNYDFWGTNITYLGYFLLYFGLMAILFAKHTRFDQLRKQLRKLKKQKAKLLSILLLAFTVGLNAQDTETHSEDDGHDHVTITRPSKTQVDSILLANIAPKEEAARFGHLVLQDLDGRMKPVNTYASELLRKLSKHDSYQTLNADQAFLSMQESPLLWYNVPIIYLRMKKGDTIRNLIDLPLTEKYATLSHFFTPNGTYKLGPYLEESYKAQVRTGIQKEFVETDQRVNLFYNALQGKALKIFPLPNDEKNTWVSSKEYAQGNIKVKDSLYNNFIRTGFLAYLGTLQEARKTGDYSNSKSILEGIKKTQQLKGAEVMLSDDKIKTEILYNKFDIFKKLFSWYMYAGTLMFIILIVQIFIDRNKYVEAIVKIFKIIILALFVLHTAGLIARWYISGHAPWSDAYESMIYVAWATMLFGLLFGRKSSLTMASTAFITAMILMIAHWNWMDPSIGTLQPVLNSYWLMIHVAIIVGSYGPFALGMVLGVVSLLLMILTNKNNKEKLSLKIKELTIINEMSLTVGLVMLTIGNFLGGMWANESWGRYWGWDPKETWALISIMIYAFVVHMRLIPGLKGRFGFNLMSIVAFASILMTYFGVNFYLAGLHSYAKDDQEISMQYILLSLVLLLILGSLAYIKYRKYYKK